MLIVVVAESRDAEGDIISDTMAAASTWPHHLSRFDSLHFLPVVYQILGFRALCGGYGIIFD